MKKDFSFRERISAISKLPEEVYDLIVIGGGINGAGVARDAAQRGMRVCLIEANDFASGTSSKSSKLIHGGIRYLENFEFGLVFEALSERKKLFSMAPHLVHPLRFLLPLYKEGRVGMNRMGLGMWLYDGLSLFQAPELHERLDPKETLSRVAALNEKNLLGSFVYSDAYMDDDRLVIETLRSAAAEGATCMNYVKAKKVEFDQNGKAIAVIALDQFTHREIRITGHHIVSTVGVWTDEFGAATFQDWRMMLRPTKGAHLTFSRNILPIECAVVMAAEKRIVFAIPRHDMLIVGTTDTDFKGSLNDVRADLEDVKYILSIIEKYFPGAKIKHQDIIGSYAGVRPLIHDGSDNEGKTSREQKIWTNENQVTFVAGGKYTTYRKISEEVVDHCLSYFEIEKRVKFLNCRSSEPLNPAVTEDSLIEIDNVKRQLKADMLLDPRDIELLSQRHGPECIDICRKYGGKRNFLQYEAMHAIYSTMCLKLVDFYTRRVPLFLSDLDHGMSSLDELGLIFQAALGWSEQELELQKRMVKEELNRELSWKRSISQ